MNALPVLIVDDEPDLVEALSMLLESAGYEVLTARDGREALALLRAGAKPGLVLLDLMMPVLDGWTFCEIRAADPALAAVPVVVITGAGTEAAVRPPVGPIERVFDKPFEVEALLAIVARRCGTPDR